MRFPSVSSLARRADAVLRRFPWTLAAGALAAGAGIIASTHGASHDQQDRWARLAFVAALGLPTSVALALTGETRGWSRGRRGAAFTLGAAALALFYATWGGVEVKHDALRFAQLAAALHLAVAFLPFVGAGESIAFWQYNRRLFLGFLRAAVFSGVLFIGTAVALGALHQLFGVDVKDETYFRIWLVDAFVVNTWIFLASVPGDLPALELELDYPRALKVFAQYILTPLVFTYLVILLAYLVKIVVGGEWPSGWVGWLVASVAVTGLLGWLLIHPLRADPGEGWIRTYTRGFFVGLIPAALMLLVAFWKRILPYGLTEPRVLGVLLGFWLLGVALLYTVKRDTSIRVIPVTLAALLFCTLYGPASLTRISVASQGRRLAAMLGRGGGHADASEASAALRFLVDHRAAQEIAARIGRPLPPIDWPSIDRSGKQDSIGARIMALAGAAYVPEYARRRQAWFSLRSDDRSLASVTGFDWMVTLTAGDTTTRAAGGDSVAALPRDSSGVARVRVGADTLAFDVGAIARRYVDSPGRDVVPAESLRVRPSYGGRRAVLMLANVNGRREANALKVDGWTGWLLLSADATRAAGPSPTSRADSAPSAGRR